MKAMFATAWQRSMMGTMLHMPKPWVAWLAVLILVNLAGGFYYFGSLEGKLVVAAFFGAIIVMEAIFKAILYLTYPLPIPYMMGTRKGSENVSTLITPFPQ